MPDRTPPLIFAARPAPLLDAKLYAAAYAQTSAERKQRIDRLPSMEDKIHLLATGMLLYHALRTAGVQEFPPQVVYTRYRKPYLKQGGIHFNLSRSGGITGWVICAVAHTEVGCDVEQMIHWDEAAARQYLHEQEYADIAAQPTAEARRERFFRYWTLKESFMKATGLGMRLPLHSFRISLGDTVGVQHSVDTRTYHFQEFTELERYKCALCAAGDTPMAAQLCTVDLQSIVAAAGTHRRPPHMKEEDRKD